MRLAGYDGERVRMEIDSTVLPSTGVQLIGRRPGTDPDAGTVVVSAHVDSTPDTPGAIDDAAGVAVLLAVADLLCDRGGRSHPGVRAIQRRGPHPGAG